MDMQPLLNSLSLQLGMDWVYDLEKSPCENLLSFLEALCFFLGCS